MGEGVCCITDTLLELTDALLCADGPVKTAVDLTLAAEHRRRHGAMYEALNGGNVDVPRLRQMLAGLPQPEAADGLLVLAVDVTHWLRPDAPTSLESGRCRQDDGACFDQSRPHPRAWVGFHAEHQDTATPGRRRLLELIDEAAVDGREEFRPLVEPRPEERRQVVTLPTSTAELAAGKHLVHPAARDRSQVHRSDRDDVPGGRRGAQVLTAPPVPRRPVDSGGPRARRERNGLVTGRDRRLHQPQGVNPWANAVATQ